MEEVDAVAVPEESQQPAVEEQVTEEVKQPQPDLASSFADLKRQQRKLREEQNKMKLSIEQERAKIIEEIKSNPLDTLSRYGVSFDTLAAQALDIPAEPEAPESRLSKELEELKAWRAEQEKQRTEADQARAIQEYQAQVFSVIDKDKDQFELINASESGKRLYWDTIVAYHSEYGEAPDLNDIAAKVENHLYEEAKKLLGAKKFKPAEPELKSAPEVQEPKSNSVTISNVMTGQRAPQVRMVDNSKRSLTKSPFEEFMEKKKRASLERLLNN